MAFQQCTREQAITRIEHFCAYQERSHSDVQNKLSSFGLSAEEAKDIIATLVTENFLNEERFAVNFAGGKFRIKKWGKNKIKAGLRQKQVSDDCIKKALKDIDDVEYLKTLQRLSEQKIKTLQREKNVLVKKRKLQNFLLQKGYEYQLINDEIKKLDRKKAAKHS